MDNPCKAYWKPKGKHECPYYGLLHLCKLPANHQGKTHFCECTHQTDKPDGYHQ